MKTDNTRERGGSDGSEALQALARAGKANEAVELLLRHPEIVPWVDANVCKPVGAGLASVGDIVEPVEFSAELLQYLFGDDAERTQHIARLGELLQDRQVRDSPAVSG